MITKYPHKKREEKPETLETAKQGRSYATCKDGSKNYQIFILESHSFPVICLV